MRKVVGALAILTLSSILIAPDAAAAKKKFGVFFHQRGWADAGWTRNLPSKEKAEEVAKAKCPSNCGHMVFTQCGAAAMGKKKDVAWFGSGLTKTDAARQALAQCKAGDNGVSGGGCKVMRNVCNE